MSFLDTAYTKRLMKLALPVMLTQVGQVSVNLFDNIIVGNLLGADALASVSLANGIFFSIFVVALGFSLAIPPLVSEAQTRGDHQQINQVFSHGLIVNVSIGLLLILLIFGISPLMYHLGQPPHIMPDAETYLKIVVVSIFPFMIFQTMREVSEGLSFTIGVTKATIIANIINIILNYILIKGFWIIPSFGVAGSAYATLIARIFMMFFLFFVMRKEKTTRQYMEDFSLKLSLLKKQVFIKLLRLGFPMSLQMFFEVTAFAAAAFICGKVSARDIAAHQIALSMASFTFNLCIGFSVASTIMVGNKVGEKNFDEVKKVGVNNLKIVFLFMLICGMVFILGREVLPTFFTKKEDVEVLVLASQLMIIAALFQLSDGIQVTALGLLRGLQDVKIPSFITFIAYWLITLPLGYYLCINLNMGAFGMWIALGIGLTISATLLVRRFLTTV
ncbi:MATE family efflux transporter [Riemerella anatipestifer]|uniref:MATE family efflux transporter n=1 Tax=Riemerella anatipestifer TaxID=34085 RepID=UPI00188AEBCB|nr:MATE family efflux transporter [Riemerella anatipestifer]MCW0478520.1 MATE family efflux transporter [Riemerella anatipestifer]MCW0496674.1 MATE family efflux transporter [Riemerella anatipestifer]QOZ86606.1 MATE family efflux transporter [Riemerella anatipestifer]